MEMPLTGSVELNSKLFLTAAVQNNLEFSSSPEGDLDPAENPPDGQIKSPLGAALVKIGRYGFKI